MTGVTCDAGIAPLIGHLNSHGWTTLYSCQGDPTGRHKDWAYIMLDSGRDLEHVTRHLHMLATAAGLDELAQRILGLEPYQHVTPWAGVRSRLAPWDLEIDWNRYWGRTRGLDTPAFMGVLRFPHEDLQPLVELLTNAPAPTTDS